MRGGFSELYRILGYLKDPARRVTFGLAAVDVPRALSVSPACVVHSDAEVMGRHPGVEQILSTLATLWVVLTQLIGSC